MPTLLDKPSSSPAPLPTEVLQSHHRWLRWRGALIALVVGLVATLAAVITLHPSQKVEVVTAIWAGGLAISFLASVAAWRFASGSLVHTAQGIDRNFAAKNRLETLAALHESTTPLAKAQRNETADYLRQQPKARPVRALGWLIGVIIALTLVHLVLVGVWIIPTLFHPPAPVPPPPPKEIPRASIIWKSPEAETKANPIEEVPTVAVATSTTGLKGITLEISVNGVPKKSQPVPASPFDKPGKNAIKVSLYMDELAVEPFDIVSYYLRGQRVFEQKLPDTTSAIQFIEVRRFRDDVGIINIPVEPSIEKALDMVTKLKLAQLKAMKENFILGHTDLATTDPVFIKENDRVGKNQGDLSKKTEEIVQFFIQNGISADVIDLLRQAEPLMDDASKKILAVKNAEALPPQGKALDLIIQIEKFFQKVINLQSTSSNAPPPVPDPFKDKQKIELKQRIKTTAGQLELLAKKQTDLAKDVNQSTAQGDPSSGSAPTKGQPDSPDKPDSPRPQGTPPNGAQSQGNQDKPGQTPGTTPSGGKDQPPSQPGAQGQQVNPAPGADSPKGQDGPKPAPENDGGDSDKAPPAPTPQSVDPFAPGPDKGTFAQRQARLLQGIEALLNTNDVLPPAVNQALQDAQKHATEAVHQLDQANDAGAKEPAAVAAQDLQRAVKALNEAGEKETKLAMEKVQQELNEAAQKLKEIAKDGAPGSQQPGLSDVAAKVQDVQKDVGDAANQQQETGSAKGAQHLADLANQIGSEHIAKDLGTMAQKGLDVKQAGLIAEKLEGLANQAANGMASDRPTAQQIAQLISELETSRANLARLAEKAGGASSQDIGKEPGQHAGNDQGQQPGKDHAQNQGQAQGQQPGKDHAQNQGQAQGQQPGKEQGQDQGQGQGQQPGKEQGQDQGQGQGQQPSKEQGQDQGQGQGRQPGKEQGQGQGEGQGQGQGSQPGGTTPGGSQPGGTTPGGSGSGGTMPGGSGPGAVGEGGSGELTAQETKALHETIADMRDEAQQAATILPNADLKDLDNKIGNIPSNGKEIKAINVVRAYRVIAPPLDKLIQDLTALIAQTRREELLKQPDLDEAPPAYRPAVSDYFENMSKDYHPDDGDADAKKP